MHRRGPKKDFERKIAARIPFDKAAGHEFAPIDKASMNNRGLAIESHDMDGEALL
jgi:hypothetical protein